MFSVHKLGASSRHHLLRAAVARDTLALSFQNDSHKTQPCRRNGTSVFGSARTSRSTQSSHVPFYVERDLVSPENKRLLAEFGLEVRCNKLYGLSTRTFYPSYSLTLIRHAESELNVQKKTQGRFCLVGHGREPELLQTSFDEISRVKLKNEHKLYSFTDVYCSPQLRALETATGLFHQPIQLEEALSEVHMGGIEGIRRDLQDPRSLLLYDKEGDVTHKIGVTGQSALSKIVSAALFLQNLELKHGGKQRRVVGVTHSNTLSLYLALLGKGRKLPGVENFTLRNRSTKNLEFLEVTKTDISVSA